MLKKRKKRSLNRDIPHEKDTNIIFIGIEGGSHQSREAKYFDIFNEKDIRLQFKVIPCKNNRSSPIDVFKHLKKQIEKEPLHDDDEVWVVIDVDRYHEHLPEVAKLCHDVGYNLAVSNPCFEYWLLLHFQNPGKQYSSCNEVKKVFSEEMESDPRNTEGYYGIFYPKFSKAVKRAQKLDVADDGDRWPNKNASRVYRIIKRFV